LLDLDRRRLVARRRGGSADDIDDVGDQRRVGRPVPRQGFEQVD
jgi:hypothetical protein